MAKQRSEGVDTPRAREMRGLLAEWRRSGEALGVFAARNGITEQTLSWWRWRLGLAKSRTGGKRRSSAFVEVMPRAKRTSTIELRGQRTSASAAFELVLPTGMTVRIPTDFDAEALRRLVGTLAGC